MGNAYKNGIGVDQDQVRARKLIKKAADGGDFPTQNIHTYTHAHKIY